MEKESWKKVESNITCIYFCLEASWSGLFTSGKAVQLTWHEFSIFTNYNLVHIRRKIVI